MSEAECAAAHVEIILNCQVREVQKNAGFQLTTSLGQYESDSLVVATGGLSFPKIGATDFGYRLAKQFGLRIIECRPGLVPLVLSAEDCGHWCDLAGISAEVIANAGQSKRRGSFREKMLLTHRGLSGP